MDMDREIFRKELLKILILDSDESEPSSQESLDWGSPETEEQMFDLVDVDNSWMETQTGLEEETRNESLTEDLNQEPNSNVGPSSKALGL